MTIIQTLGEDGIVEILMSILIRPAIFCSPYI